jgi:arylsulfatase A-like enzyme
MDQNIGRVMQKLKEAGVEDNTIVMFFSDNGACPFERNRGLAPLPGGRDGWRTQSAPWANVGNTPFRLYKQNGHEGGAHNHFIVSWPKVIKAGTTTDELTHVVDIFPTLLDVSNVEYPATLDGEPSIPLHGSTLLPVFEGKDRKDPDFILSGYSEKKRMFLKGDIKLVRSIGPWELYNIKDDPTEMHDLAKAKPDLLQKMLKDYEAAKAKLSAELKDEKVPVNYPYRKPARPGYDEFFYNQYRPIEGASNPFGKKK